jgi:hypothetical protein
VSRGIDSKGDSVEIPGAPTLRKTHGLAPIVVELPFMASASVALMILSSALVSVACLAASFGAASALMRQDAEGIWSKIASLVVYLLIAMASLGGLASFIADARRPRPTLRMDGEGLRDERSQFSVLWRDVAWIAFYHRGKYVRIAALGLRKPRPASRRLFQPEGLVQSTPENEAHVMITRLDKPAETIVELMKALVRQHGGRVDDVYKPNGRLRL